MNRTRIQWTERTWNPVTGCTQCSSGCEHCYAQVMATRLKLMGIAKYRNGFELTLHPECLEEPLTLKGKNMVFVCSMSDLFHESVPFDFIDKVMDTIERTPECTYQVLTKRAERMEVYFNGFRRPPANAWIGTTAENAKHAHLRMESLRKIRGASVRFLSCEPLLEDLGKLNLDGIDWVIVGGESGPKGRKMEKEWALSLKRQCENNNIPFFFKQWGTWGEDGKKRNNTANGCLIDGREIHGMPETAQEAAI